MLTKILVVIIVRFCENNALGQMWKFIISILRVGGGKRGFPFISRFLFIKRKKIQEHYYSSN